VIGIVADTRDVRPSIQRVRRSISLCCRSQLRRFSLSCELSLIRQGWTSLLQKNVWSVDKDLPLTDVKTMNEIVSATVSEPKFHTWLLTAFAGVGLVLTLIGI